ncbi:hypothetical protein DW793_10200 [Ruminococcus sp. AM31-15AC]|nr:hypothetical protein DW793_10200 [Ruminococcus sp. AM31-15AC]
MFAFAVLSEYGNTVFALVYKPAQLVPSFKSCDLCGIGILLIYENCVGKTLLIHLCGKTQKMCKLVFIPKQLCCYVRPVFTDGL